MSKQPTIRALPVPAFASRSASLGFDAQGRPLSLDEAGRSIEFTAATEAPTLVMDWERWEPVNEVLLMSGLHLPGSGRCVFLDTHSRHSVSAVIGSFRDLIIGPGETGSELRGRACYSRTPDGEGPYLKTVEGHVTDVSIGYEIHAFIRVEDGQTVSIEGREFTGPLRVVTDWTLKEVSLCPIGADEHAKARAAGWAGVSVKPGRATTSEERTADGGQAKEQLMSRKMKSKRKSARSAQAEVLHLRAELARAQADLARARLRESGDDDDQREGVELPGEEDDIDPPGQDDERNQGMDKDEEERDDPDDEEERDGMDKDEQERQATRSASSLVRRERARIADIRAICRSFNISREQEDRYVRKGTGVNTVRREVLAMLQAERGSPAPAGGGRSNPVSPLIADAERRAAKGAVR